MTVVTIESDSEQKTNLLVEYAEKLGLPVKTDGHRVLSAGDMVQGIGRKATDAELEEYILKGKNEKPIDFPVAFAKYLD